VYNFVGEKKKKKEKQKMSPVVDVVVAAPAENYRPEARNSKPTPSLGQSPPA
jgi:hypothetical protein